VEVHIHAFLISALHGGEGQFHAHVTLSPGKRSPGTQWIGCWVGSRGGLDVLKKENLLKKGQALTYLLTYLRS
jgi:hypothetical protein